MSDVLFIGIQKYTKEQLTEINKRNEINITSVDRKEQNGKKVWIVNYEWCDRNCTDELTCLLQKAFKNTLHISNMSKIDKCYISDETTNTQIVNNDVPVEKYSPKKYYAFEAEGKYFRKGENGITYIETTTYAIYNDKTNNFNFIILNEPDSWTKEYYKGTTISMEVIRKLADPRENGKYSVFLTLDERITREEAIESRLQICKIDEKEFETISTNMKKYDNISLTDNNQILSQLIYNYLKAYNMEKELHYGWETKLLYGYKREYSYKNYIILKNRQISGRKCLEIEGEFWKTYYEDEKGNHIDYERHSDLLKALTRFRLM